MFQNFIFFLQWIERPISPCYTSCISIEHGRATQLQIKSQCIAWLFFTFCFVLFGCCLVVCFFTVTVLLLQRALHSTGGAVVCAHNLAVAPLQCLNYQLVLFWTCRTASVLCWLLIYLLIFFCGYTSKSYSLSLAEDGPERSFLYAACISACRQVNRLKQKLSLRRTRAWCGSCWSSCDPAWTFQGWCCPPSSWNHAHSWTSCLITTTMPTCSPSKQHTEHAWHGHTSC